MAVLSFLAYSGFKGTKNASDYLVGGRQIHPIIMALSYGATFISTSAIVGFGGNAGLFGMSLLWLTFLNIFVGVFIAFVVFGKRTRKMGHNLDAHTFPELMGLRFRSKFIQGFSSILIFLVMPIYTAAVLKGGVEFMATTFNLSYDVTLFFLILILAVFVSVGGMNGVMYGDAFPAVIAFGMAALVLSFISSSECQRMEVDRPASNASVMTRWLETPAASGMDEHAAFSVVVDRRSSIVMAERVWLNPSWRPRRLSKSNRELTSGRFRQVNQQTGVSASALFNVLFDENGSCPSPSQESGSDHSFLTSSCRVVRPFLFFRGAFDAASRFTRSYLAGHFFRRHWMEKEPVIVTRLVVIAIPITAVPFIGECRGNTAIVMGTSISSVFYGVPRPM